MMPSETLSPPREIFSKVITELVKSRRHLEFTFSPPVKVLAAVEDERPHRGVSEGHMYYRQVNVLPNDAFNWMIALGTPDKGWVMNSIDSDVVLYPLPLDKPVTAEYIQRVLERGDEFRLSILCGYSTCSFSGVDGAVWTRTFAREAGLAHGRTETAEDTPELVARLVKAIEATLITPL